jgi:hypothetical protein
MDVLAAAAAAEALMSSPIGLASRSAKHFSPDEISLGPPPSAPGIPFLAAKVHHTREFNNSFPFIFIPGGKNKKPKAIPSNTVQGGAKGSPPWSFPPALQPSNPIPVYIELPVATFTGIPNELFAEKRKYSQRPFPSPKPAHALPQIATNTVLTRAESAIPQRKNTTATSTVQEDTNSNLCISYTSNGCYECGATRSTQWRPQGPKTLCNACGLRNLRKNMGKQRNINRNISLAENSYDPAASHVSSHIDKFSKSRKSSVAPLNVLADPEGGVTEKITAARRSSRTSNKVQNYNKMNGGN